MIAEDIQSDVTLFSIVAVPRQAIEAPGQFLGGQEEQKPIDA